MLRRLRGQIIGWGIPLALLGVLLVSVYDSFAVQQDQFQQLIENYPSEFLAFFGGTDAATQMFEAEGFLSVEFFSYMPIVLGIFAVLTGSGLLARDEEEGRLDLIQAYPLSRSAFLLGRVLAFVVVSIIIMALIWLGMMVPMTWSSLDLGWGEAALALLSLLVQVLLFGTLSLLLSMVLPSRRLAAMGGGLLLMASYFINSLARIEESLEPIANFSPLHYYQGAEAIGDFNVTWFLALLGFALLFALLALLLYRRRDLRVSGEGGWQLPLRRGSAP
jgi:ABC-2 type transport system permease protein